MKNLLGVCLLSGLLLGCATVPHYDVTLREVERPTKAKERYGEQKISTVEEEDVTKYSFEDDLVNILWIVGKKQLAFVLKNKTSHSIKIIWDEAVYVDEAGSSHRIVHSGVKYTDKNSPQSPSVVIRGGTLEDSISPSDYISYSGGYWRTAPLLPEFSMAPKEVQEEKAREVVGKQLQVLLPLQIEGVTNEYIFLFTVDSYVIGPDKMDSEEQGILLDVIIDAL